MEQQHTFLYTCTSSFLIACFISRYSICCIFFCKVYISYSIIHLIEVFAVIPIASHSLKARNHLLCLPLRHHLRHRNTSIEGKFVWRMLAKHFLECLIGFLLMPHTTFYLTQKVIFTSSLLASHFMLYDFAKIFCCFVKFFCMKIVVTQGIIPFLLRPPVDAVALHVANHIFCII